MIISTTPTLARRIEIWPTDRLVPYARNARTHSPEQVAQIAASIVEFGFVNPILVDTNAGIIAGHGRLLAARKLGLGECPVVVLDHLSETQRRAYIIADNKLAQNAGWDDATLAAELRELETEGVDLGLVGFSDEELEVLLGKVDEQPEAAEQAEDQVPEEPANPVTRPGDIWLIGRHSPICGDCRDLGTVRSVAGHVSRGMPSRYSHVRMEPRSTNPLPQRVFVAGDLNVVLMAGIPGEEIERLKHAVSLDRLVEAQGISLARHGADLLGLCPFHEDRETSLVASPRKHLGTAAAVKLGMPFRADADDRRVLRQVADSYHERPHAPGDYRPVQHRLRQPQVGLPPAAARHSARGNAAASVSAGSTPWRVERVGAAGFEIDRPVRIAHPMGPDYFGNRLSTSARKRSTKPRT